MDASASAVPPTPANPAQGRGVEHRSGPLLISASPGSGNTFTLVKRIVHLITTHGATPESILVVTLTEKTAAEFTPPASATACSCLVSRAISTRFTPTTFHGICLRLLDEHRCITCLSLFNDRRIKHDYFTGMLNHGQCDFFVQHIDPDSHRVRTYYPDFLFQKEDGTWVIVEVKGEHQSEDPMVKAKQEFAEQMATASRMTYRIIRGKAFGGGYGRLFE